MLKPNAIVLTLLVAFPSGSAMAQGTGSGTPGQTAAETRGSVRHVVELFTSQGCSSCPPADALLTRYAARADVVALTLAVDYWDYLGWKDTLGSPKNSKRQREYANSRGDGMVYTPQIVVDGRVHANGAKAAEIETALGKTSADLSGSYVPVEIRTDHASLTIEASGAPGGAAAKECTLWLAMVQRRATVPVRSGENKGQTLTYTHVVRDLMPLGSWSGKPLTVRLDTRTLAQNGVDSYVALLQSGTIGPIMGASQLVTPATVSPAAAIERKN